MLHLISFISAFVQSLACTLNVTATLDAHDFQTRKSEKAEMVENDKQTYLQKCSENPGHCSLHLRQGLPLSPSCANSGLCKE